MLNIVLKKYSTTLQTFTTLQNLKPLAKSIKQYTIKLLRSKAITRKIKK
jgi:hypothetical protein